MKLINKKENMFNDNIAQIKQYDFSKANMSDDSRLLAVTTVASICYGNPKSIGKESLYNRLAGENAGLPSSSFEFVPILIHGDDVSKIDRNSIHNENSLNVEKYGDWIWYGAHHYLLTNLRALMNDLGQENVKGRYFNTEEECKIIKQHFKVFRAKIDLNTRSQLVRHRNASYQELSRRYVSDKREPLQFYISDKMKNVESRIREYDSWGQVELDGEVSTNQVINICLTHYNKALDEGVKPEEARRIIPQAAYTDIWTAWKPAGLNVFFKLRLDSHAQWEIRQMAGAMITMIAQEELNDNPIIGEPLIAELVEEDKMNH